MKRFIYKFNYFIYLIIPVLLSLP